MCNIEKKIIKTIEISPTYLNNNLLEEIHKKVIEKFLNVSDKEENIVILQIQNVQIISNVISKDALRNYFTVSFHADCFHPHENCTLQLPIVSVSEEGILFKQKEQNIDYFIHSEYLEEQGFTFQSSTGSWIHPSNNNILLIGTECKIKITELRFQHKKFNCICTLV